VDEQEAPRQVITRPAVELQLLSDFVGDNPEAIVLNFVQPEFAGGRLGS
jgi:hypothetical protein